MKSQILTNSLLLVIVALLLVLCIHKMRPQEVVIYQNGSPVGSGLRSIRGNALAVQIVD